MYPEEKREDVESNDSESIPTYYSPNYHGQDKSFPPPPPPPPHHHGFHLYGGRHAGFPPPPHHFTHPEDPFFFEYAERRPRPSGLKKILIASTTLLAGFAIFTIGRGYELYTLRGVMDLEAHSHEFHHEFDHSDHLEHPHNGDSHDDFHGPPTHGKGKHGKGKHGKHRNCPPPRFPHGDHPPGPPPHRFPHRKHPEEHEKHDKHRGPGHYKQGSPHRKPEDVSEEKQEENELNEHKPHVNAAEIVKEVEGSIENALKSSFGLH